MEKFSLENLVFFECCYGLDVCWGINISFLSSLRFIRRLEIFVVMVVIRLCIGSRSNVEKAEVVYLEI